MATFQDLEHDWSMVCQDYTEWTITDLQLAAELGKTLLERNKELENNLRQHQHVIDDQSQEIEYLTKQTVALREVNDSRLRIYEQLEVSIQDLERANHRLAVEGTADKKQIKSMCKTIESLESRCEELSRSVEELNVLLQQAQRRKCVEAHTNEAKTKTALALDTSSTEISCTDGVSTIKEAPCEVTSNETELRTTCSSSKTNNASVTQNQNETVSSTEPEEDEFLVQALNELRDVRNQLAREQRRSAELEEQLAGMVQENRALQQDLSLLQNKPGVGLGSAGLASLDDEQELRSMQDELSVLDEVRQGQLCGRCLRTVDPHGQCDDLSLLDPEEDDCSSTAGSLMQETRSNAPTIPVFTHRTTATLQIQGSPKKPEDNDSNHINPYRDLVEKYEALLEVQRRPAHRPTSLQDELRIAKQQSMESAANKRQVKTGTPTDLSETETTSSGYSDETSNKSTQTDGNPPGSFLFTVVDGEDCKFSIYDDKRPVDSRFRNQPEYKTLFKEIFGVLKKAAENKDDGEQLPLLDDNAGSVCKVPPVTPCNDNAPDSSIFTDDTASVTSSVMSERVTESVPGCPDNTRVLTPYRRQPLEYLTVGVNVRKKSSSRRKQQDRAKSPATPSPSSPRSAGRRRRDFRPLDQASPKAAPPEWNGNSMQFYNRAHQSPSQRPHAPIQTQEYKPSTASQDLNKLKKLELSYAEVLRKADKAKNSKQMANRRS